MEDLELTEEPSMVIPAAPVLERLRSVPLFATCTDRELAAIDALVKEVEVPAGRMLVAEGQPLHEAFVVVQGEASVSVNGSRIGGVGPGAVIGEVALVDRSIPRSTVTAVTSMQLLVIDPRSFSRLLVFGDVALNMMRGVADRLRAVQRFADSTPRIH